MNFIVNRRFTKNTDEYRRAHFFALNIFFINIICIALGAISILSPVYNQMFYLLYLPVVFLTITSLVILYTLGRLNLSANVMIAGGFVILLQPILKTGGAASDYMMWLLTLPLCAITITGLKNGIYWIVFTLFYQILVYNLDNTTYNAHYIVVDKLYLLLNHIAYLVVIFATLITYEMLKAQQQNIIEKQLDDITLQSEVLTQKNIELERFAFIASHDLRTPLRNIISFSGLLNRKLKNVDDTETHQYMTFIKDYAYHMTHIVDDILEFAKIDKSSQSKIEIVDLEEVKTSVLNSLKEMIKKRNVIVHTEGVLPKIEGDKTHLVQLMQNIVENAITYNEKPEPEITIGIKEDDHSGKYIYVKDNGIGIDTPYQDKVFEMFTRLHSIEKYPGTGLGLAICKKIVLQYGGRIWLNSELNKGTTVNFMLPLAA